MLPLDNGDLNSGLFVSYFSQSDSKVMIIQNPCSSKLTQHRRLDILQNLVADREPVDDVLN